MSDLNQNERNETKELLKRGTTLGVEMADFSLDNLANKIDSDIDQTALDNIDRAKFNRIKNLMQRLSDIKTNKEAVNAYTIDQFKVDFLFLAEFFKGSIKSEITTKVNAVDDAAFEKIKEKLLVRVSNHQTIVKQNATGALETARVESFNLSFEQSRMLRDIPNVGQLVEEVRDHARNMPDPEAFLRSEKAKEILVDLLTDKAYAELEKLFRTNLEFIASIKRQEAQEKMNEEIKEKLEVRVEGIAGINNLTEHAGNIKRLLVGSGGFKDINDNPLLVSVLSPEQRSAINKSLIATAGKEGHVATIPADLREQVKKAIEGKLEGKTVADIDNHFRNLYTKEGSHDDLERIKKDREIMVKKLRSVPKHWQNTDEAKLYEDYVLENGPDSYDFMDALDRGFLGEVGMIRKLIMMVKGLLGQFWDLFSSDSDAEEWERIEYYQAKVGGGDPEKGDITDPEDKTKADKILNGLKEKVEKAGKPNSFNITRNGKPFKVETDADIKAIEKITQSFGNDPKYYPLFTKGIDIVDLHALAENVGDQDGGAGFNVEFTDSGFTMSYDLQNYIGDMWVEAVGAGAGAGVATLGFGAALVSWPAFLAALAGGTAVHLSGLDQLDMYGDRMHFNYDDLSPQKLHAAIEEMKADVGLIEEAFKSIDSEKIGNYIKDFDTHKDKFDFDNIKFFPPELFGQEGISPAFKSLLELDSSFWNGYQMTGQDMRNFAAELDHSWWWDFTGDIDNEENAVRKSGSGFVIQGSSLAFGFWKKEVNNAQEFFKWLKEENS